MDPLLPDYERWREMNSSAFNVYDYIYGVFRSETIAPDLAYALFKLIWPQFIEIGDEVFLKETYDDKRVSDLKKTGCLGPDLEYWMNLVSVESLLPESHCLMARQLTDELAVVWQVKLKNDFPKRSFYVRCVDDDGEKFLVFSQKA